MELSVIVPVFNEAGNIAPLIDEIERVLGSEVDHEIIIVDDGSTDDGLAEISSLIRNDARLRILRHSYRSGQSAAILTGVRAARGAWIVTLDGDGQNPPTEIPRMLMHRDSGGNPDTTALIAGVRRKRNDKWLRRWSSRIANGLRSRLLNDGCPDTGCGLKLVRRDVFLSLPHFNHMHRFLPALVQRAGHEVSLVEVSHRPRRRGRSKYGISNRLWVGIVDIAGVMWLNRRACHVEAREFTHE